MNKIFALAVGAGFSMFGLVAQAQPGGSFSLPEGDMKPVVESVCAGCHNLSTIRGSTGYDENGWRHLITGMVDLPEPTLSRVVNYLADNYPYTPGQEPTLVDGDYEIEIVEWRVPTLGQRPRDPFQDEAGDIWWAGMYASLIGRFNPETGDFREYQLVSDARPHSIIADENGDIWYMGNGNGTVGKLDPVSGEITEYPMPIPGARDPHTPHFADDGQLFFTLQRSNMVGRLNPDTGDIRLITLPTANVRPYGIKQDSQGMFWVAYNGHNGIARVNPDDMSVTEFINEQAEGSHFRRLAITSDDMIWYVDSGRGYLGRLNPNTGEFTEWPSPSGPTSHPYAIEVVDDVIWYNESGMRPDALVRFDPETETFQSWAMPSGVGQLRHMRVTPEGNLAIHQTSTNTIGLAILPD